MLASRVPRSANLVAQCQPPLRQNQAHAECSSLPKKCHPHSTLFESTRSRLLTPVGGRHLLTNAGSFNEEETNFVSALCLSCERQSKESKARREAKLFSYLPFRSPQAINSAPSLPLPPTLQAATTSQPPGHWCVGGWMGPLSPNEHPNHPPQTLPPPNLPLPARTTCGEGQGQGSGTHDEQGVGLVKQRTTQPAPAYRYAHSTHEVREGEERQAAVPNKHIVKLCLLLINSSSSSFEMPPPPHPPPPKDATTTTTHCHGLKKTACSSVGR